LQAPRRTDGLLEDPGQVGRLEEVGITLERWARLRSVPIEYARPYGCTSAKRSRKRGRGEPGRARGSKPPSQVGKLALERLHYALLAS
jgi:hypothetical protein